MNAKQWLSVKNGKKKKVCLKTEVATVIIRKSYFVIQREHVDFVAEYNDFIICIFDFYKEK